MQLLNGKELSDKLKESYKKIVAEMNKYGKTVSLAVIQVGNNSASSVYVRNKERACQYVGIQSSIYKLDENTSEDTLLDLIESLNVDTTINGILVQLPLPGHINKERVIDAISPEKDVDGFHVDNVGRLVTGRPRFIPCTASGIIKLLLANNIEVEGKNCVIVGRSDIVGKPVAIELLRLDATVTICHSKTKDLKAICKNADILICAIGKPRFFTREYIREGAIVVDVGIHRLEDGTMCGDVDFNDVKAVVSAITPVPKGVGAMTVAMLLANCVDAAM